MSMRKAVSRPASTTHGEDVERRLAMLEDRVRRMPARITTPAATSTTSMIQQTTHGLAVKNVIRHNGTIWTKSQADTAANAVVGGIVIAVLSPDVFVMATGGYVAGLSGLTAGSVHYLDATTAGALTTTAPSIAIPIILADTTTSGALQSFWAGGSVPNPLVLGSVTADGTLQIYGDTANGVVVEIQGSLVTTTTKKLTVREIDVCDAGTAKKMLVIASATY
jgi:hypothetical protein